MYETVQWFWLVFFSIARQAILKEFFSPFAMVTFDSKKYYMWDPETGLVCLRQET